MQTGSVRLLACVIAVAVGLGSVSGAQSPVAAPDPGAAVVKGRVVALTTHETLPRADVTLVGRDYSQRLLTDAQGGFSFFGLPAGRYLLTAAATGYLQRDFAEPLTIRDGEVRGNLEIALPRSAVVTVRVTDEAGEPIEGARVTVSPIAKPVTAEGPVTQRAVMRRELPYTDDEGRTRLWDLEAGSYVIEAHQIGMPESSTRRLLLPTFYPGVALRDEAKPVVAEAGRVADVTIPLVSTPVFRVSGRVTHEDGSPVTYSSVELRPVANAAAVPSLASGTSGEFLFTNVVPGTYRLTYQPLGGSDEPAAMDVVVDRGDVSGLSVVTRQCRPGVVRGRVMTVGRQELRDISELMVGVDANGTSLLDTLATDGTFTLRTTTCEPRALTDWHVLGEWSVTSVRLGDRELFSTETALNPGDALDVRVVLERGLTEFVGRAVDEGGRNSRDYTVVVFAADPTRWKRSVHHPLVLTPDDDGAVRIVGLPAGRYLAVAVETLPWQSRYELLSDPMTLPVVAPQAVPLELRPGKPVQIVLPVITL